MIQTIGLMSRRESVLQVIAAIPGTLGIGLLVCIFFPLLSSNQKEIDEALSFVPVALALLVFAFLFWLMSPEVRTNGYTIFKGLFWDPETRSWSQGVFRFKLAKKTDGDGMSATEQMVLSIEPHQKSRPITLAGARLHVTIRVNASPESPYSAHFCLHGEGNLKPMKMGNFHLLSNGCVKNFRPASEDQIIEKIAAFGDALKLLKESEMPDITVSIEVKAPEGHSQSQQNQAMIAGILTGGIAGAMVSLATSKDPRYKRFIQLIYGAEDQTGSTGLRAIAERFGWEIETPETPNNTK